MPHHIQNSYPKIKIESEFRIFSNTDYYSFIFMLMKSFIFILKMLKTNKKVILSNISHFIRFISQIILFPLKHQMLFGAGELEKFNWSDTAIKAKLLLFFNCYLDTIN